MNKAFTLLMVGSIFWSLPGSCMESDCDDGIQKLISNHLSSLERMKDDFNTIKRLSDNYDEHKKQLSEQHIISPYSDNSKLRNICLENFYFDVEVIDFEIGARNDHYSKNMISNLPIISTCAKKRADSDDFRVPQESSPEYVFVKKTKERDIFKKTPVGGASHSLTSESEKKLKFLTMATEKLFRNISILKDNFAPIKEYADNFLEKEKAYKETLSSIDDRHCKELKNREKQISRQEERLKILNQGKQEKIDQIMLLKEEHSNEIKIINKTHDKNLQEMITQQYHDFQKGGKLVTQMFQDAQARTEVNLTYATQEISQKQKELEAVNLELQKKNETLERAYHERCQQMEEEAAHYRQAVQGYEGRLQTFKEEYEQRIKNLSTEPSHTNAHALMRRLIRSTYKDKAGNLLQQLYALTDQEKGASLMNKIESCLDDL